MLRCLLFLLFSVSLFCSCRKGDFVPGPKAMRFTLESFVTDTALFYQVQLDDSLVASQTGIFTGTTLLATSSEGFVRKDSIRLRVLMVKKNGVNLQYDSTIFLSNVNEFLLLQLDPSQKPQLINKLLENATAIPPAEDTIKVRFFFNTSDQLVNARNGNSVVTALNVHVAVLEPQTNGTYKTVAGPIFQNIRVNQLSAYFSLAAGGKYGFQLWDTTRVLAANRKLIQNIRYSSEDLDFVEGRFETAPRSIARFQTIRIGKSAFVDVLGDTWISYNGRYLFGFK